MRPIRSSACPGALLVTLLLFLSACSGGEQKQLPAPPFSAGDGFGTSVAISGDFALVGAPYADERADDSGAAHVYRVSGKSWQYEALLSAVEAEPGDEFGQAVALDNGNAVVGAHFSESEGIIGGAVFVFVRHSDGSWIRATRLSASTSGSLDYFGSSVAIDGPIIAVGAPGADLAGNSSGAVYVFTLSEGEWMEAGRIIAPGAAEGDRFGASVAVDNGRILAGAPNAEGAGGEGGAAFLIERTGDTWTTTQRLSADLGTGGEFGAAVAISGPFTAVGAPSDSTEVGRGSVVLFQETGQTWMEVGRLTAPGRAFGTSVSLDGVDLLVGAAPADRGPGAAYAFTRLESGWTSLGQLASVASGLNNGYGRSVAISGDRVVVGADGDQNPEGNPGRAYSYFRSGNSWK
jgi:hypothetical protein